ncbi:MAG: SMP-30/gluconolactonase/LRE family protein [Bacteroidota bacterium]
MNTKYYFFAALLFLLIACDKPAKKEKAAATPSTKTYPTTGSIERLDPALDQLIDKNAKIEVLTGAEFQWSEGPLWIEEIDAVIFSDVPQNKIYRWDERDGLSLYLTPAGTSGQDVSPNESGSNGLTLNLKRQLVLAQHGNRHVSVMDAGLSKPEPAFTGLATTYNGKKLNSPNDVIFDSKGNMYFTDPPYGLKGQDESEDKEQDANGVYKVDTEGNMTLLTGKLTRPNGLALSPDEKTLYVANSDPEKAIWMAYEMSENGIVSEKLFFDATSMVPDKKGLPDGLKIDDQGMIYATGPGGVLVFNPSGTHLGTINTEQATANCAFNADKSVLYMTAHQYLMRIALK